MREILSHRKIDVYSICNAPSAPSFLCGTFSCKNMHHIVTIPVSSSYYARLREINNARVPFIMNGPCSWKNPTQKPHNKKMHNGSYYKNNLLNKAFTIFNPPVTTLLFSDALQNTVIPRPNCIYSKETS